MAHCPGVVVDGGVVDQPVDAPILGPQLPGQVIQARLVGRIQTANEHFPREPVGADFAGCLPAAFEGS